MNTQTLQNYIQTKFGICSDEKLKKEDILNLFKIDKSITISIYIGGRIAKGKSYMISSSNYTISKRIIDGRVINAMIKNNELVHFGEYSQIMNYTLNTK